ncbi:hypothetical protein T265_06759 [Opisthorchis viverrini]|uniref:ABC transporter domain-containing protein n=1 Tax=Opisthorchis viverrini TaxID=6198 RepID=A0A074ZR72_OPIVI|nr:hypothetical protein T265_06759 [Opisthorchis viverrini]KER25840.1 hypothetical protein T265_06759 [Opisthorchis viverrini]
MPTDRLQTGKQNSNLHLSYKNWTQIFSRTSLRRDSSPPLIRRSKPSKCYKVSPRIPQQNSIFQSTQSEILRTIHTTRVYVDGVDIRTVPLSVLRSRILSICQEPFLFSGTLRDNLDPEGIIPNAVLHQVLFNCQLATTVEEANTWLERDVGEAGRDISAGQRQLICLARALLRQPRPQIICLDEATAAVDYKSEEAIHDVLDREFEGTTLLLIAHRLSSVKRLCSRVLVMDSGQIVAEGDPERLLANGRIQIESAENTDLIRL